MLDVFRSGVPAGRTRLRGNGQLARVSWNIVAPLSVAADGEVQLMNCVVGADLGDVLVVFRCGVPAGRACALGDGHGTDGAGNVVAPLSVATDSEVQLVDLLVGADIGDVLHVFRSRVPAGRAGA